LLDVLKAELPSAIERELRSIKLAADHLQLFARNSLSSYKMQSGQMELASVFFSPVKLCTEEGDGCDQADQGAGGGRTGDHCGT